MAYNFKSESEVKEYINNLGIEYRFGCYSEKKPEVCHLLADFLESIKKDYEKAGKVYRTNCDDYKYGKSCLKYGTYSLLGKGSKTSDYKLAYDYFEKGCHLEEPDSCLNQGLLLITKNDKPELKQDVIKGMQLLEKACQHQNGNACYYLSGMYIVGVKKDNLPGSLFQKDYNPEEYLVQKNMKRAFEFALKGCDMGNMYSCANLSQMYAKGDGVEKNEKLAEKYKTKAMEMQKDAQSNKTLTFQEGLNPT
ncbi:cytochrome c oxidase assembly factor 7 homolog [Diorhabda carinulata]|uniref:cytochrome c oxidase assembly factor 7 homolog n=1 Tax=Diorhabda sublineata TaxID=1163346 RepID=UPI0024E0A522|nr:cytochrome c oxidase assembly factor 7 homolog [Diorhabda sublineata]XP_057671048.1 cytochrome c oxidase assembly factor 7 homolog [Diorhabda carinulata]